MHRKGGKLAEFIILLLIWANIAVIIMSGGVCCFLMKQKISRVNLVSNLFQSLNLNFQSGSLPWAWHYLCINLNKAWILMHRKGSKFTEFIILFLKWAHIDVIIMPGGVCHFHMKQNLMAKYSLQPLQVATIHR
jgi:hypothetical protein